MPSITTWTRLEPISRDADTQNGLEARVHDPLWSLARQWQMGEFRAEDAGSPTLAHIETHAHSLTRYAAGPLSTKGRAAGQKYDPRVLPLETLVEQEPVNERTAPTLRLAIDAGRHFLRLAAVNRATAQARKFLKTHAVALPAPADLAELDAETRLMYETFAGRVVDGSRLFREFSKKAPKSGGIGRTAAAWLAWYREAFAEPAGAANPSWLEDRLEYCFAVSARAKSGEIVLESAEYSEGRLDWYDFSIREKGSLGATASEAVTEKLTRTVIPAPVHYAGMPSERWWEFEDAKVHFGAVDAKEGDVVSAVMLNFAITYGNDWFVLPVSLQVGSICEVKSLVVTDVFGVSTAIEPFSRAHPEWRLFSLSQAGTARRDVFFLPPVLTHATEGPVSEEVLLTRDELMNIVWAIERVVQMTGGGLGDRRGAAGPGGSSDPLPASGELAYRLMAEPPDHWIPFVPVEDDRDGKGIRLRRARLDKNAQGKIVGSPTALTIANEEVPRGGVIVQRSPQWARWIDGSSQLWIGRRKLPGAGEASSGLRFDYLESKAD